MATEIRRHSQIKEITICWWEVVALGTKPFNNTLEPFLTTFTYAIDVMDCTEQEMSGRDKKKGRKKLTPPIVEVQLVQRIYDGIGIEVDSSSIALSPSKPSYLVKHG